MSEVLDFNQILGPEPLHVDSWNIGQNPDDLDIMTALGVSQDYPDLDELLDIGDASDVVNATNSSAAASFDANNCVEILDWYSDTSEIPYNQYGSQIEFEKDKKENEAGLLEALQKSMDLECESASDLVSLSSSLNQAPLASHTPMSSTLNYCSLPQSTSRLSPHAGSSLSPSTGDNMSLTSAVSSTAEGSLEDAEDSDESMLKQLLLSRTNTNYPREVDSNNNAMPDNVAVNIVPKMADNASGEHRRKKKSSKKLGISKKPFTELLKHFESTNPDSASKRAKANSTRVVNASRYQKQYGSAPASRLPSPIEEDLSRTAKPKPSKTTKRAPVATRTTARRQTIDVTLPLKKSSVAVSRPSAEKMIVAADANTLLDILENKSTQEWKSQSGVDCSSVKTRMLIDKRRSTVLIDPLPHKRQKINTDGKITDEAAANTKISPIPPECTEKPSAEHDYCQKKVQDNMSNPDLLKAALHASGLPSSQEETAGEDASAKASKVLKWQDYLQRVRLGIRSAPNSPTCSPKMRRGSARVPNNFMVLNQTTVVKTTAQPVTRLVEPIVAAKAPKQKANLKLQEFEEYLANLQSKTVVSSAASPCVKISQGNLCPQPIGKTTVHKLAPHKEEIKSKAPSKRSKQVTVPNIASKSFVKISSNGVVHTAAVSSAHSSAAPLVMIQIPKVTGPATGAGLGTHVYTAPTNTKYVSSVVAPTASSGSASATDLLKDPRIMQKPKAGSQTVVKPISKVKWNAEPQASLSKPVATGQSAKPSSSSGPTFKLVTSNKGGMETKSLILSGVSGKLKEILTLLAQQQQEQGAATTTAGSSQQQQKTLQQLLTAVSNLKSNPATSSSSKNSDIAPTVSSKTSQSSASCSQTSHSEVVKNISMPESKKSVPSPLSLIHEIKQNLNKKSEPATATAKSSMKTKPQYVYTVPASSSVKLIHVPEHAAMTAGGGVLSLGRRASADAAQHARTSTSGRRHSAQTRPRLQSSKSVQETNADSKSQITVFVDQADKKSSRKQRDVPHDSIMTESELLGMGELANEPLAQDSNISESDLLAGNDLPQHEMLPYVDAGPYQTSFISLTAQSSKTLIPSLENATQFLPTAMKNIIRVKPMDTNPTNTISHDQAGAHSSGQSYVHETLTNTCSATVSMASNVQNQVDKMEKCDMAEVTSEMERSGIVQGMEATDIVQEFNVDEVLQQVPESNSKACDVVDLHPDPIIEDVGIEETVECGDESGNEEQPLLFNKLPAYLYSGKVLSSGTTTGHSSSEFHTNAAVKGLKDLNHDPLIGSLEKNSDLEELHYNKVPHYLRGGKACPRMPKEFHSHGHHLTSSDENYPVLKRTPDGAVVNTKELFYSRLPSYYSAGRYHVVDTVTEPPPPEDVTVTPETMWKQDQEEKRKKREKKKKRKKKRKKQSKKKDKQLENDRLLYSKLPHYFLAGRRSLVPDRRASEQSYSSSLSDSSHSDQSDAETSFRSRAYHSSYSPKRDRSASLSSWSSRSESRSPERSWRAQRYRVSSRSPMRGYSSSDSDYSTHRSKVTRKRRHSPYSSGSDWESKRRKRADERKRENKNKAIQERRVMYVGGIDDSVTKNDLRRRFEKFGTIEEVSLHFRRDRDSYAFVTFRYTCDTFEAIEKGNSDVTKEKYTLCFGGRREFCQVEYADLDEAPESNQQESAEDDFDTLLKKAMRR